MKTAAVLSLALLVAAPAQESFSPDAEGFIRNWLVLAPIGIEEGSGATEIDKEQIKDEGTVKPKAGDAAHAGGKELKWAAHKTADFFIDFLESFGKDRGQDVAGYAVAYVHADAETAVKAQMGSNDQAKLYVNGKCVIKFDETRTLEKDQNAADVTLNKGCNLVVFKVINEQNNWQGCLRFTDKTGAALKNLKITLAP